MVIGVRHTGQPAASSATLLAQDSQKRACPHGTKANPCRGSTRHTSQQSSGAAAAAEVGADDAADRNATRQSFRILSWACFIVLTYTPVHQCQTDRPVWRGWTLPDSLAMSTLATLSVCVQFCNVQSCNFSAPNLNIKRSFSYVITVMLNYVIDTVYLLLCMFIGKGCRIVEVSFYSR